MKAETLCARVNLQSTRVAGAVNLHDTLNTLDESAVCLHPHGTAIEVHHVTGSRTAPHLIAQNVCPLMVLEDEVFLAEMAEGPSVDADLIVVGIFRSCAWRGLGRRTTFCIGILIRVTCCATFIATLWLCARRRITAIARHVIVFTVTIGVIVITISTTAVIIIPVTIVVIIIIATSITTPSVTIPRRRRHSIISDLHLNVAANGGIPRDANLWLAVDASQSGADLSLSAIDPRGARRGRLPRRAHAVLTRAAELQLAREQLRALLAPAGAPAVLLAHALVEREAAARDDLPGGDGARQRGAAQVGGDLGARGGRRGAAEARGRALRGGGKRGDAARDAGRVRRGGGAAVEAERDVRGLGERGVGEARGRRGRSGLWRPEEGRVRGRRDGAARGEEEEGQQQEEGGARGHGAGAGAVRRGDGCGT